MTPNQEEQRRLPPSPPLSPFSPSGDIDYIPMSPLAIALRETYTPTEFKSKGLKKVIGVVAMVAIPFAAPAISASIAASGFLGATASAVAGTWVGSAVVGAGLGAVSAAITGGDWKKGAIGGAIGGGLGGLASSKVSNPAWMSGGAGAGAGAGTTVAGSGLVPTAGVNTLAAATTPATFGQALTGQLATTFTPTMLAQNAIKLGGSLMMEMFVADDYSDEQLALIEKQKAIVEQLEAQGQEVDQIQLTQAKSLLQQALQVSPNYIARQNEAAMKNKYAKAGNEAVRAASTAGIRNNYAQNISRRTALEGGAAGATAYDQGLLRGIDQKVALTKAGLSALPTGVATSGYYENINNMYKDLNEENEDFLSGTQQFWGSNFAAKDKAVDTTKKTTIAS